MQWNFPKANRNGKENEIIKTNARRTTDWREKKMVKCRKPDKLREYSIVLVYFWPECPKN